MLLHKYTGQAIKNKRIERGQTLRGLSSRAFISYGYLSEVERGLKDLSSDVLLNICNGLKVSVTDLMIDTVLLMQEESASASDLDLDISKELLNGNYATVRS